MEKLFKPQLMSIVNGELVIIEIDDIYDSKHEFKNISDPHVLKLKETWFDLDKSYGDLSIQFSIAGRKAKAWRKSWKKFYEIPKPYKYYGVIYKNFSHKRKLAAKTILKNMHSFL